MSNKMLRPFIVKVSVLGYFPLRAEIQVSIYGKEGYFTLHTDLLYVYTNTCIFYYL